MQPRQPVQPIRAGIGRRLRLPLAVVALSGLAVTGYAGSSPAGAVTPSRPAAATAQPIGDSCLTGHWSNHAQTFFVRFHDAVAVMTGLRGAIETDHASGRSVVNWNHARDAHGTFAGYPLTERVRGKVTSHLAANFLTGRLAYTRVTTHHLVETFTWRGHVQHRHHRAHQHSQDSTYSCTATTFTTESGSASRM